MDRIEREFEARGFGLWAVEARESSAFIGFVGLMTLKFQAEFTPAVEVGWRLARDAWGHGYATEAATASLAFGFDRVGLDEVVSTASLLNVRSQRVMQRIGMHHDTAADYDHPSQPPGHPLQRHMLYRMHRESWRTTRFEPARDS